MENERAELTESYTKIVTGLKPSCFAMENVDREKNNHVYSHARAIFKKAGYGLTEIILDAILCGSRQKRKRFICFAMLNQEDNFTLEPFQIHFKSKPMTFHDYFCDSLGFEFYYRKPRNYCLRAVFSIDDLLPTCKALTALFRRVILNTTTMPIL